MPSIMPSGDRSASAREVASDFLTDARTRRGLAKLEAATITDVARIQAVGIIQAEKSHELSRIGQVAMTEQAILARQRDVLSGGDAMLHDELRFFQDLIRSGQGAIIGDTIAALSREGRRFR